MNARNVCSIVCLALALGACGVTEETAAPTGGGAATDPTTVGAPPTPVRETTADGIG